jgi:hypothetical protein
MSVEEAQEAFYDLYTAVFKNKKDSPEKRALTLENEIKKLLDALKLPHTTRMSDFSSSRVYVVIPDGMHHSQLTHMSEPYATLRPLVWTLINSSAIINRLNKPHGTSPSLRHYRLLGQLQACYLSYPLDQRDAKRWS